MWKNLIPNPLFYTISELKLNFKILIIYSSKVQIEGNIDKQMPNIIFNPRENDCYHRLQSCHEELHTTCEENRLKLFVERICRASIYIYIYGFDESYTKISIEIIYRILLVTILLEFNRHRIQPA